MAVYTITLAFTNHHIFRASIERYYKTRNTDLPFRHVIVDQHYPIDKEETRAAIRQVAAEFGIEVWDPGRNLGLHGGFNWALKRLAPKREDIIIGYDGDSWPITYGWDMALVRAIQGCASGNVVWSSIMNPRTMLDLFERGYDESSADGYLKLWLTKRDITNSICAWSFGWLSDVGLLREERPFYGHLEAAMFSRLGANRWAVLPGWLESDTLRSDHDRSYILYKWVHSHLRSFDGDFEAWLAAGKPIPDGKELPNQIP